ncbi:MAG TPA: ribonuclease HI [Clostridiales bacterium]|nr:ribonuclease HI [Eubacteriales bacterium]HBR32361.1 ribonuclease HI [Clostridiales bacterium]
MKKVNIYTDGACRGNPGAGGYGVILEYDGREKELSEGFAETTNNRMELTAAIVGLEALKQPCEVTLYSDSKYLVYAIEKGWLKSWRAKNWKKSDGKQVLNIDLWERLIPLIEKHRVSFVWVKGHDGNKYNERCDTIATTAADKIIV